jgi:hypothetical protein
MMTNIICIIIVVYLVLHVIIYNVGYREKYVDLTQNYSLKKSQMFALLERLSVITLYNKIRLLNKKRNEIGPELNKITNSWQEASKKITRLKAFMTLFNIEIDPYDDYLNYCRLRSTLERCTDDRRDCINECPPGKG